MTSKALSAFETLMNSVDELIDIHQKVQTGQGRRHRQEALHRAGVVLIIAAWQAYIEKISDEALDLVEKSVQSTQKQVVPAWVRSAFYFRKPAVRQSIGSLNTPNSDNVIRLLDWSFGFNPRSIWIWAGPRRIWGTSEFCQKTDSWLRIRHTIAHGNSLPDNLPWIKNAAGTPRLTLALLREAKRHFEKLAELTDVAFAKHLRTQFGIKTGWYRVR